MTIGINYIYFQLTQYFKNEILFYLKKLICEGMDEMSDRYHLQDLHLNIIRMLG